MKLSEILIGMLVVAMVAFGFGGFYTDLASKYSPQYGQYVGNYSNSSFRFLNKTSGINEITDRMSDTVMNISSKSGWIGSLSSVQDMATLFLDIGKIAAEVPGMLIKMVTGVLGLPGLDLPAWFDSLVIGIITITIVFAIASIFMRRDM